MTAFPSGNTLGINRCAHRHKEALFSGLSNEGGFVQFYECQDCGMMIDELMKDVTPIKQEPRKGDNNGIQNS